MVIDAGIVISRVECACYSKIMSRFCASFFEQHMVPLIPSWLSNNDVEPWANSIWERFCLTKIEIHDCCLWHEYILWIISTVYFSMVLIVNLILPSIPSRCLLLVPNRQSLQVQGERAAVIHHRHLMGKIPMQHLPDHIVTALGLLKTLTEYNAHRRVVWRPKLDLSSLSWRPSEEHGAAKRCNGLCTNRIA